MPTSIETLKPLLRATARLDLAPIVAELRHSREVAHNIRLGGKVAEVPSSSAIAEALDGIVTALFPTHLGPHGLSHDSVDLFVTNTLSVSLSRLADQLARGLRFDAGEEAATASRRRAEDMLEHFAQQLPAIRALLVSDLRAAQRRDATAESMAEVLICYPGARALIHHRIAHVLHGLGARFVARIISALAQATTGIDIHPAARIGPGLFIGRGLGVAIGETAVIGSNVSLSQGVTLGEADPAEPARRAPRHPIIEDNVVIHAGSSLHGRITIGAGSIIGGNLWLTRSVPPGTALTQASHAHASIQSLD